MNKTDIYRNSIFILTTVVGGVALIYLLFAFVNNPFKDSDFRIPTLSNKQEIEKEINNFDNVSYDSIHVVLPILLTKISSSGNHGLIQKSTMNYSSDQLIEKYRNKILGHCEIVLVSGRNYTSLERELSDLEKVIGEDSEIDYYLNQINRLHYYTYSFRSQLERYINDYSIEDNDFNRAYYYNDKVAKRFLKSRYDSFYKTTNDNYIIKAETTPGLEYKFKNDVLKENMNILINQLKQIQDNFIKIQLL